MPTVLELKEQAKELGVKGYSKMNKKQLEKAIEKCDNVKYYKFTQKDLDEFLSKCKITK